MRNNIPKVTFMLISANRKDSSNKQDFPSLSLSKNEGITIPNVSSYLPSIFSVLTSIFCTWMPSYSAKLRYIILTSLSKSIKASIIYILNWVRYWIYETRCSFGVLTLRLVSILASIIDAEVAKTNTNILAPYQSTYLHSGLSYDRQSTSIGSSLYHPTLDLFWQ